MGKSARNTRTPQQIARDKQLRAKYQATRPSLAELQASPEYTPAVSQGEFLEMLSFAARIKSAREEMRLSLSELADRSGIDKAAISRLENGLVENPTYATLDRIAKALQKRLRLVLEDDPARAT